jgi:hypothetical protein
MASASKSRRRSHDMARQIGVTWPGYRGFDGPRAGGSAGPSGPEHHARLADPRVEGVHRAADRSTSIYGFKVPSRVTWKCQRSDRCGRVPCVSTSVMGYRDQSGRAAASASGRGRRVAVIQRPGSGPTRPGYSRTPLGRPNPARRACPARRHHHLMMWSTICAKGAV